MPSVQLGRFEPMQPTLVAQPFHRPGWIYEEKYDGWRMLAYKDGRKVRLVSRRGRDHTATFPDITAAIASLPAKTFVLDGEVCVFNEALVSQFHLLTDDAEPGAVITPPMYAVFDCCTCAAGIFGMSPCRPDGRR
jgi:bifunctional non-homologous end joining protein LigD